ncbi:MAG: UDP-N-acetylmuramoyl-L-alanyl-D-glutamate--2,6-diaminopimelate ligase [Anaerovoracaceae bacterium]|jgi:UDP-N-acetylmuramoyl-L-alanyl-D-glutamate--2,6-diaminopimelate ligase
MKLNMLIDGTGIHCPPKWEGLEITGISYDSRKVKQGDAFVCLKGMYTDGHKYAEDAVLRGAHVVISEENLDLQEVPILVTKDSRKILSMISAKYYGFPSEKLTVLGITGTNGKTTISYMIKSCLEASEKACGLTGTISYQIGKKEYEAINTTPESLDLQRLFSEMLDQGIKYCVMEVSSHALQLGRVENISFDYSVFTNFTQDHMDFHKDQEEYYQAKKKLFKLTKQAAIINVDDKSGKRLYNELLEENIKRISCSLKNKEADYYGEIMETGKKGSKLMVFHKGLKLGVLTIHLPGGFSLYNTLLTATCLSVAGIDFLAIEEGLKKLKGVPGRFELVKNPREIFVIVDFAHTPDALEKVLQTGAEIVKGRIICVFGCGGDRDTSKRPLMGEIAGNYADYCIVTSDNPRTESQKKISKEIEVGLYKTGSKYEIIDDRRKAIAKALSIYQKGDLILITGKGHENYQIVGRTKTYFSDQETVRELIEKMNGGTNERD